jgi:hypothetical protein
LLVQRRRRSEGGDVEGGRVQEGDIEPRLALENREERQATKASKSKIQTNEFGHVLRWNRPTDPNRRKENCPVEELSEHESVLKGDALIMVARVCYTGKDGQPLSQCDGRRERGETENARRKPR